jgi:uncharacterized surface protein with fasciclin (FAS1) repeats
MVSYQGTFEFFDDAFCFPENAYPKRVENVTYPSNSITGYIVQHHPKFAYILKLSKLDGQMADQQFRGTIFLPLEDSIPDEYLPNMDTNTARRIVKYHFMVGLFPKEVLFTSPCQQLQTTMKGQMIMAMMPSSDSMVLNNYIRILQFDILQTNGIIHIIEKMLI